MLLDLVPRLRCPHCSVGALVASPARTDLDGRRIVEGTLRCGECGDTSTVTESIWDAMGPHRANRTLAQLSNVLAPTARLYERVWRHRSLTLLSPRPFPIEEELHELQQALDPHEGTVALDVACSEGLYARALADAGATVLAIDHSIPFLRRVVQHERARVARSGRGSIVAVRALAQHLPVRDGAVDAAAIGGSLNEIGDAPAALSELTRTVTPGGHVFSMHLVRASRPLGRVVQALIVPSGIAFRSDSDTVGLFRHVGLAVDHVATDGVVQRVTAHRALPA